MQVSFIVPLFNCLAYTRECLRTLSATLPAGLSHEVILVDDGSTDGTREWLATLPPAGVVILNPTNLGFAGTCNRGAAAANGELLFFLNNDLILLPGWFEPMATVLQRKPRAGLVGNIQLDAATGAIDHAGISFTRQGKPAHDTRRPLVARIRGLRHVPALTGACIGLQRKLWQELGGFDDGFVNGGEDIDLCLRASAAGRRNYVALHSLVRHHVSAAPGRKRHDEANSRRLALRWRETIAAFVARDLCRAYLETQWIEPKSENAADVCAALGCWLGLRSAPPDQVRRAVDAALETEFNRWRQLLG